MKVICLGNFPPRQCGIATFTENLVNAILGAAQSSSFETTFEVIAMNDSGRTYDYPPIVKTTLADQHLPAYIEMAAYINRSGADLLLVQHEYGIFGGNSGLFLLGLLRRIKIPVVCTLHTVLEKPGFHQLEVLQRIAQYADKVVIMNEKAIGFLKEIYQVPAHKIALIEHGTPDFIAMNAQLLPPPLNWKNRRVLITFGLIGRSKGIETVLRALPEVVKKHPEVLYVILGKTHPHVKRQSGEEYRESLVKMVGDLQLQNNVEFINNYVSEVELMSLLEAAEMYVTPYHNKAQITSGTLCYAVSAGCAVFSTPYWHAETLLADDRGWLFDFGNHAQLSQQILFALDHPEALAQRRRKAREYGKTIAWPVIGKNYLDVFGQVVQNHGQKVGPVLKFPQFDISHLLRMTDETGLLQHANGLLPSYQHGYSLDDNTRAMLVVITAYKHEPKPVYLELLVKYFSFLKLMLQKNGQVKNYLTYERQQLENDHSDDAYGRAIWALGYLIRYAPNDTLFQSAHETFHIMINAIEKLEYARGYANSMFGVFHYIRRFPDQERFLALINQIADLLVLRYEQHQRPHWHWFEDALTYDNGLIPAALYLAYSVTGNPKYLAVAEKSRLFLESKCFREDWLSLIGNKRWLRFDSDYELFAQQPIDAMAMMFLYKSAHLATAQNAHIEKLIRCHQWFMGDNDLNISLYDQHTKGCNDGIENNTINQNQGAESLIAWLLAQLLVHPYVNPTA